LIFQSVALIIFMEKIKLAVIGCGYWGKNLVRNMSELGVLAAVVDNHLPTASAIAKNI
jgi:predicted dehydrogenase